jgi:hypothetical protein
MGILEVLKSVHDTRPTPTHFLFPFTLFVDAMTAHRYQNLEHWTVRIPIVFTQSPSIYVLL